MRIMIIDDTHQNLVDAQNQLGAEHDLVLCDNVDKAWEILTTQKAGRESFLADYNGVEELRDMTGVGLPTGNPYEYTPLPKFDVVLTDLMMPGLLRSVADKENFMHELQGMGYPLVLLALQAGVKYVGILSATNHHANPMASFLDGFRRKNQFGEQTLAVSGGYPDHIWYEGDTPRKNWDKFLASIIA
jgi:CheY-like chemotaxis protein